MKLSVITVKRTQISTNLRLLTGTSGYTSCLPFMGIGYSCRGKKWIQLYYTLVVAGSGTRATLHGIRSVRRLVYSLIVSFPILLSKKP